MDNNIIMLMTSQKKYWKREFEDEIPVLDMPYDYARPQEHSFNSNVVYNEISIKVATKVMQVAKRYGATEYRVFRK